jgi:hypothetical protein
VSALSVSYFTTICSLYANNAGKTHGVTGMGIPQRACKETRME